MKRAAMLVALYYAPAWGSSIVYSSLSAWQASSPGSTTVLDFEATAPAFYSTFSYSPYSFSASTGGLYLLPGAAAGTGSGQYLTTDGSSILNVTLSAGVYGLAFNLGSNSGSSSSASILATDVNGVQYLTSSFTTSSPSNPAAFWGLRNDVQLASVRITFTGIQPQVDNVRYANTALASSGPQLPEPAPWMLVSTGAVLILLKRPVTSKSAGSSTPSARRRIVVDSCRKSR